MTSDVCKGCGTPVAPSRGTRKRIWCSEKCRKGSYGQPCIDCGARTTYGAESALVEEPRCPACAIEARRIWTPESIIEAFKWWAREFGEPPSSSDWDSYVDRKFNDRERAARYCKLHAKGKVPDFKTVHRVFGSWSNAMVAAGFVPRPAHGGGGNGARHRSVPLTQAKYEEAHRRWHAGETAPQIAAALGITSKQASGVVGSMRERGWDMPHRRSDRVRALCEEAAPQDRDSQFRNDAADGSQEGA